MGQEKYSDVSGSKIVTSVDYIESLRDRQLKVYLFGELVEEPVDHPMILPSIYAVADRKQIIGKTS